MSVMIPKIYFIFILLFSAHILADEAKVNFFIIKSVPDRAIGMAEGLEISKKEQILVVLHQSKKYGFELMSPFGDAVEKNELLNKLKNKYPIQESKENSSFYSQSVTAAFANGKVVKDRNSGSNSAPTNASSPANLDKSGIINLQSPGTILASCGSTAKLLQTATSQAGMQAMNKAGSGADASWRAQQDYKALTYMAEVAQLWSQTLDRNYQNLIPPTEMGSYLNETTKAMYRFNKMVAQNPWNGVDAWQYCVNRYQIGLR